MDEIRLGSRTLQPGRQLLARGERVPLGKRALDILSVLAEAKGEIVTKDELLAAVWPGVTVEENALQVHIVALRKALGPEAERLKTIRGVGYQLDVDGEAEAGGAPASETTTVPAPAAQRSDEATPQPPTPSPPSRVGPLARVIAAVRTTARTHRLALALALLVAALAATWTFFGSDLGLRPHERIPVVVRPLIAEDGGAGTDTALASGITDELIVRLRRLPELRVATADANGAMPSETFRNAYIVDGNIRSSGDRLRVTARLFRQDGEVLWSQTFDRAFADLFNVQEEIASAIANTLSVSFDVGGNSTAYGGTDNPEAYAAYMQAYARQIDTAFDRRPYLEQAVALDPHYAKARSALYGDYGLQISLAASNDKPRLLADLDRNTREALAANPDLWIPEAARGMYDVYRHDFVSADRRFRRVVQLDQGLDPELRSKTANYHMLLGRVRKAVSIRQSNQLIDPIQREDPFGIYDRLMLGEFHDAIRLFTKLEQRESQNVRGFVPHVFWSHTLLGREAVALQFARQHGWPQLAEGFLAIKNDEPLPTLSRAQLRRWAERRYGKGAEFEFAYAGLYASHLGHPELAVQLMRLAFEEASGGALFTLWHPAMAKARKTPEFIQLVTDLGMVRAWQESGDWGDFCRQASATKITCT